MVRSRINTALLHRQQEQQLSFRGDLATSPLLIAMPPYRQVPMHAWVRQIEGVNFYRRGNQLVSWDLIVRSSSPSVLLVLCYFSHFCLVTVVYKTLAVAECPSLCQIQDVRIKRRLTYQNFSRHILRSYPRPRCFGGKRLRRCSLARASHVPSERAEFGHEIWRACT